MADKPTPDNLVSLDRVRALQASDTDPAVAYMEILWNENTFAVHAAIRDLEAMRTGKEDPTMPLRDPETVYEAQIMVDKMRWMANFLARQWGLEERVRPEDWQGDEREVPQ